MAHEPNPKPNGFRCQISPMSSGSGVKFNPTTFFRGSDFQSTQPEPDPLSSLLADYFTNWLRWWITLPANISFLCRSHCMYQSIVLSV
jgi:hypothetical protein